MSYNCPTDVKTMPPVDENCERSIRRSISHVSTLASFEDLTVPQKLAKIGGEPRLIYDNEPNAKTAETFFMDVMFDTTSPLLRQSYTIRVPFGNAGTNRLMVC
ncbi:hypothetical protein CHS0354_031243 [Potamilus streckersoni]|uniref:Uncharacterized protein n=1 Tax=Potamilus streckersoni TaxID=2493646 RepID=A0AAE0VSY4_9BIVA|nr:hypothetical protein CHS0354_031243 [Potamilus streckersoni]